MSVGVSEQFCNFVTSDGAKTTFWYNLTRHRDKQSIWFESSRRDWLIKKKVITQNNFKRAFRSDIYKASVVTDDTPRYHMCHYWPNTVTHWEVMKTTTELRTVEKTIRTLSLKGKIVVVSVLLSLWDPGFWLLVIWKSNIFIKIRWLKNLCSF